MPWIWQQVGWPDFTWDQVALAPYEARFLHESGRRIGAWRHLGEEGRTEMRIEWLSEEAFETSAIERALSEKALARSIGRPSLIAFSRTIARKRKAYYHALGDANRSLEITDWLVWFAGVVLEAQAWSERRLIRSIEQSRMLDRLHGRLNPRQDKALRRLFRAEPEEFEGGLSADNYRRITGAPASTATRDLTDMVAKGALRRTGMRRYTRYYLDLPSLEE